MVEQHDDAQVKLGKTHHPGSIAALPPTMLDHLPAPILVRRPDHQTEGIVQFGAVVQPAWLIQPLDDGPPPDLPGSKVLIPLGQVFNRGVHVGRANDRVGQRRVEPVATLVIVIAQRATGDDLDNGVVDDRPGHPQRAKDPLLAKRGKGLPANPLADQRQQDIVGVDVQVFVAGVVVQRSLRFEQPIDILCGGRIGIAPFGQRQQLGEAAPQPAGVVDQVADGDRLAKVVHLGQVLAEIVVEGQRALVFEQRDGKGGELFGHRADVKDG